MKIGQNWSKIESSPPGQNFLNQKGREVFKMIKKATILSEKFAIPGSFDEKPSKMGTK